MKTRNLFLKSLKRVCTGVSFLMISSVTTLTAQSGLNDPTFNTGDKIPGQGANNDVSVSIVQPDNKIIIAGAFTTYNGAKANMLTRLNADGKLDKQFKPGGGPNGSINSIDLQTNGKIMIAGNFTKYHTTIANGIARLNASGTIDNSFNGGAGANGTIFQVINQHNDKVLVAGDFTTYNSLSVKGLVRLNKNGTLDPSFQAIISDSLVKIQQVALQADGKIIVAGLWRPDIDWYPYHTAIRLNTNGTRDYSFQGALISSGDLHAIVKKIKFETDGSILMAVQLRDAGSSVPYHGSLVRLDKFGNSIERKGFFWINDLLVQQDGKIIITGYLNDDWYSIKRKVVRLNKDFQVDSTFLFNDENVYRTPIECFFTTTSLQVDEKIIIGGHFFEINGLLSNNIARLNINGLVDNSFNQHKGCNGTILATAVQQNQRILIAGNFSRYNYEFVTNIARLKKNGELDASFNTGSGANGRINTVAIQDNGKILIGGKFTSYSGNDCHNIARLNSDGSFDESFSYVKADNEVRRIKIDADGRILLAGDFKNVNKLTATGIARIFQSGELDATFNSAIQLEAKGGVYDFSIAGDGDIYTAVIYRNEMNYTTATELLRLDENGNKDIYFTTPSDLFFEINCVTLANNGQPLAGGMKDGFSDPTNGIVVQFATNGAIDDSFDFKTLAGYLTNRVRTITVLENNKQIITGDFDKHIALINADASVNQEFVGSASNTIYTTALVTNEKMLVAGSFTEYESTVRNSLARIDIEAIEIKEAAAPLVAVNNTALALTVYPVPASSVVHVTNLPPGSTFKIFNTIGKEMYSTIVTEEKISLELEKYVSGIYFIIAENNGKKITGKFCVSK